jgi:hypothetical protein
MASQHTTAAAKSNRLPTFNDYPYAKTDYSLSSKNGHPNAKALLFA